MSYQPINKPIPKYYFEKKRDCKDFKACILNMKYCRLSNKCKKCGYHQEIIYESKIFYEGINQFYTERMCIGITEDKWGTNNGN